MNSLGIKILGSILLFYLPAAAQQKATVVLNKKQLNITVSGYNILQGLLSDSSATYRMQDQQLLINGANHQIITITATDGRSFELEAAIYAGKESIACESDPDSRALKIVRHTVGPSHNLRNQAVYDRQGDWLLSFDTHNPKVTVVPALNNSYDVHVKAREIVIRFRPNYYKKHRGLSYFNPAEYSTWKKPVVGWCSWFAYFNKITEENVKKVTNVLAVKLKPFGLDYIQIDDGYQQVPIGLPETWLQPNNKFPSGLKSLAGYISSKGMIPGIWTNVSFADSSAAFQNRNLFVKDSKNDPARGNWVGYVMDGSNPAAIKKLISPVYKGLANNGWQYFKLDALRHLKYEGYNSFAGYFSKKGISKNEAFRNVVKDVRKQIGKDNFLLACWGIRPELVGIADGCRIGDDGYSYAGLAQFNSYNNIIWRNDPDHIELSEKEAFRSCTATSLTGSLFMLTDKPEIYKTSSLIRAAQQTIPVLYTQPGQVYDVDPSVSSKISMADIELSGSGPRPFDAGYTSTTGLFALEINKEFENWLLLGRLDERDKLIPFTDLGLDATKQYLVFEFWSKQFIGDLQKELTPPPIDTFYNCQVFCFREKLGHPQLLATNRHISCGAVELRSLHWERHVLTGSSETIADNDYIIYIYEPAGYVFDLISCKDADAIKNEKEGMIRKITLASHSGGLVNWKLIYK